MIEKRYDGQSVDPFSKVKIDWTYDALNRLVAETRDADPTPATDTPEDFGTPDAALGDYTDFFGFDLAGNRLLKLRGWDANGSGQWDAGEPVSERTAYRYNARDQLLEETTDSDADGTPDSSAVYAYDANGSTISVTHSDETVLRYTWDLRNKLVGLDANGDGDVADEGDATFDYDFAGVRVRRSVIGEQTTYYLQTLTNPTGYSQVLEEWTGPNGQTTRTLARSYLIGQDVIAQSRTGAPAGREVEYLLYDGGGHTRGLLDATGQPLTAEIYAYDAFGNRIEGPSVTATSLLYRGEYFDTALGQYVLRARYYDPTSGRFWSFDSYEGNTADPLSLHKYLYANGNPVYYLDPTGRSSLTELNGVIGNIANVSRYTLTVVQKVHKAKTWMEVAFDLARTIQSLANGDLKTAVLGAISNARNLLRNLTLNAVIDNLSNNMDDLIRTSLREWIPWVGLHYKSIDRFLIYMPNPVAMKQRVIKSNVTLPGLNLPLYLVFGGSGHSKGRVVGMGLGTSADSLYQMWRMDCHVPIHRFGQRFTPEDGDASVWKDGPVFHYHVLRRPPLL